MQGDIQDLFCLQLENKDLPFDLHLLECRYKVSAGSVALLTAFGQSNAPLP